MHALLPHGSCGVIGAAGVVQRVLLGPPGVQKPACAREHTQQRERGAGGHNGGGGVHNNWGKRADAMGTLEAREQGEQGAGRAGAAGVPYCTPKNRPSGRRGA